MTDAFDIVRGDTFSVDITIKDSDGNPVDLTGTVVYFTAKRHVDDLDADAALKQTIDSFATPETGTVTVTFDAETTALLKTGTYWWDIQYEKEGIITSTTRQSLRVVGDITRRTGDAS